MICVLKHFSLWVVFLLLLSSLPSVAQETNNFPGLLSENLVKAGLENVAVKKTGKNFYIFFENRLFRWEPDAINEVFSKASPLLSDSLTVHLVALHHHLPMTIITRDSSGTSINFHTDSVNKIFQGLQTKNQTYGKIDLVLLPGFAVQFGNYDHPVEWQVSLTPILETSLWRGMSFSARVILPVHSELQQPGKNKIRTGTIAVNQLLRLRKDFFINFSAGMFSYPNKISAEVEHQRHGFNTDLRKYFLNSNLLAGGYAGVTGQSLWSKGTLNYWPLDRINYGLYGEYHDPVYQLTTRLTAGKFLYDDFALRIDLARQFREVSIGFFALKSDFGYNGGFNFIIPIAPRRQFKPAPARIRLANYLRWEYKASSVHPSASIYDTGSDLDQKMRFLNTNYLKEMMVND